MNTSPPRLTFYKGLLDGIPIALGYFSVSFGFGIQAAAGNLPSVTAALLSLTNVTSAGQLAGLKIILEHGPLIELIIAEFIINIRYALMSISLTQKLENTFKTPQRMLCAFAMTDEIFAVAASQKEHIRPKYFYGLMLLPIIGWVVGTFSGAVAGNILPASVQDAMGIALYAMFLAIILPPSTGNHPIAIAVIASALISVLIAYLPMLSFISTGFSIVISAIIASVLAALFFPVKDEIQEGEENA
ncbi:MAG: AzlC family ABC transporter permease [Clostridia bacterium]|nr:AzlC family ABC transporter permease [Clostridia bacterium]